MSKPKGTTTNKTVGPTGEPPVYMTVKNACAYFGIGLTNFEAMLREPNVPGILKVGKWRYIHLKRFEEYLKEREEQ